MQATLEIVVYWGYGVAVKELGAANVTEDTSLVVISVANSVG